MGFIIHKYFLSKSLKAPPPSESKKKKSGSHRRYSQPGYGSRGLAHSASAPADYLTVPDSAYATSGTMNTLGYQSHAAARRRRSSMASMRRASIAGGTVEDSFYPGSSDSLVHASSIHRRMSLQTDSFRQQQQQQDTTNTYFTQIDELQNSYSSNCGLEDTKEESSFGGESEESRFRPQQRRFSTSSVGSGNNLFETNHSKDSTMGTAGSLMPNSRMRQENKWLQVQLKQYQRHCSHLEAQLYGARDQLAFTNASWLDQLYDAQHKHQQEVFQTQRQAEQASNSILEQEMEELKTALLMVAEEEAKLEKKKKTIIGGDNEELDVATLVSELQAWKDRHAQSTANAKRIQDILEQEAREFTARLQESERHVAWLEEQLRAVLPTADDDENYPSSSSNGRPISRRFVTVLHNHQAQLEDRIQELLMENAHLQRGQSEAYGLQSKVKELEAALTESQEQYAMHQTWHAHQIDHWKQETTKWKDQVQAVQRKLDEKMVSREAIRAEYATRIESLEAENVRLKNQLENRQKEWIHQSNLKDRTIESLQSRIDQLEGEFNATTEPAMDRFGVTVDKVSDSSKASKPLDTMVSHQAIFDGGSISSSIPEGAILKEQMAATTSRAGLVSEEELSNLRRAKIREKELLMQVSRLEESEANAQRQIQRAHNQIKMLQELLQEQSELTDNEANNNSVTLEPRSSTASADDSCIEQLLEQL